MNYNFLLVMIQDSGTVLEKVWSKTFDNAVEAVKAYEAFTDHGMCVLERVITLTEPNGKTHRKVFKYPYGSTAAYDQACVKWRNEQFDPRLAVK